MLDTNVVYSALRSRRGASNAVLRQVAQNAVEPVLSVALMLEYEDVLMRYAPALGYSAQEIGAFLDYLSARGVPQRIHYLWRPQLRDPNDDHVLELAANAACPYIVTFNLRDFAGCGRFGIRAITPAEFLEVLGGSP